MFWCGSCSVSLQCAARHRASATTISGASDFGFPQRRSPGPTRSMSAAPPLSFPSLLSQVVNGAGLESARSSVTWGRVPPSILPPTPRSVPPPPRPRSQSLIYSKPLNLMLVTQKFLFFVVVPSNRFTTGWSMCLSSPADWLPGKKQMKAMIFGKYLQAY